MSFLTEGCMSTHTHKHTHTHTHSHCVFPFSHALCHLPDLGYHSLPHLGFAEASWPAFLVLVSLSKNPLPKLWAVSDFFFSKMQIWFSYSLSKTLQLLPISLRIKCRFLNIASKFLPELAPFHLLPHSSKFASLSQTKCSLFQCLYKCPLPRGKEQKEYFYP